MEEITTDDDNDDRISQLPEFILHHIMSFFDSPVDLVRMSVLSNYWFALTTSFPILNFDIRKFAMLTREIFFKYVEDTTSKFCQQNVTSTHTFNLVTSIAEPSEVDIIDKCLELILKKGVQVLYINLKERGPIPPVYRLPKILLSASSLTSLTIHSCGLPSSLMIDAGKFNSLKLLDLYDVHLDDEVIKRLTTNCPLLKEFNLVGCHDFKIICVCRHQNLLKVLFGFTHKVERIDIEASNLFSLSIINRDERGAPCMNLALCKKLTMVSYCGFPSPKATLFADFLSNFPFIKGLFLKLPKDYKNLKLSSSSLKKLLLYSECDLEEIDFNTPNLLLFLYGKRVYKPAPLVKNSPHMECYPEDDVDALWFQKLRRFLDKNKAFKVLTLHISAELIDVEELNVIQSPPYELEHVELHLENIKELSVYVAVVDVVLWCCRPRSLTLISDFSYIDFVEQSHVIKFTYEKLLQQEDESQTNIQIVSSSSSKAKNHFSNLHSLLAALPRDQLTQTITFTKEKVLRNSNNSQRYVNLEIP